MFVVLPPVLLFMMMTFPVLDWHINDTYCEWCETMASPMVSARNRLLFVYPEPITPSQ